MGIFRRKDNQSLHTTKVNEHENKMIEVLEVLKEINPVSIAPNTSIIAKQKIALFFLESSIGFCDSLYSEFQSIQDVKAEDDINEIQVVIDMYNREYQNEEEKRREYLDALNKANKAVKDLIKAAKRSVNEICEIHNMSDNQKRFGFFQGLLKRLSSSSVRARRCLDAVLIGMSYIQKITEVLGCREDGIFETFGSFIEELLSGDTCLIMYSYDKSKTNKEYWLTVPQAAKQLFPPPPIV